MEEVGGAGVAVEIRGLRRKEKLEGKGVCACVSRETGGKGRKVVVWEGAKALCSSIEFVGGFCC